LAKSRKQKVLEEVRRRRHQRTILSMGIVVILVAIIVTTIFLIPRPQPNQVQLPAYLARCVYESLAYHSHPELSIMINRQAILIPVTIDASCPQPIHTHDSSAVLHVEADENRNYTLGDWFLLWGHWSSNRTITIFNSTQIFSNKVDASHHPTMTVNGASDTPDSQNLQFPRNAGTTADCEAPGGCQPFNVAITYG
jgi:hypothetical protein